MTSVRPHLWFSNNQAVEAARFYAEHIPDSSISNVVTAPEGVPGVTEGTEFIVEFTVAGLPVSASTPDQSSPSTKRSRSTCWSRRKARSIATGSCSPPTAASQARVAGARTGSACRGR